MTKPHPVLSAHYGDEKEKQRFLRKVFDEAAPHYEGIARWGWLGSGDRYRIEALRRAGLAGGMRVLDVAAGTGPTARAVKEIVGRADLITCLEPSAGMIAESKKKLDCEHIQAGAEAMPVGDATYDCVTMGFALRHVDNLAQAFAEFHRVIRPGGKVIILDVTLPKSRIGRWLMKAYFKHTLPLLTRIFTRSKPAGYLMSYYWETMDTMTPPETVIRELEKAGFTTVTRNVTLGVFSEYTAVA